MTVEACDDEDEFSIGAEVVSPCDVVALASGAEGSVATVVPAVVEEATPL